MNLIIMLLVMLVLMFLRFPLYISFLSGCVTYFILNPDLSLILLPQRIVVSLNSFPFLAIPLFMVAGQIMNRGGITNKIFNFSNALVGRFRGGLGYVNILGSFIFSGMSGSALADLGGLGVIEMKAMREAGYPEDFTIGVTAASATLGPIVPPSLPFVTYALFAGVSLGSLFMAGFAPGIIMVITMSILTFIISRKKNFPRGEVCSFIDILKTFGSSFFALLSPAILIFGIWLGIFTPTEAALVCVLYSIFIGLFVYRDMKISDLPEMLLESFKGIVPVCSIVIATIVMAFIFNYEGVDQKVFAIFSSITDNKYVFLTIINIFLLLLGMVLDPSVSGVVLIPVLAPVAASYGVDLIHFGVIFSLNLMIGLVTPPVGMSLYLLQSLLDRPFTVIAKAVLPWLIPLAAALIVVTYWEGLILFVPRLLGMM